MADDVGAQAKAHQGYQQDHSVPSGLYPSGLMFEPGMASDDGKQAAWQECNGQKATPLKQCLTVFFHFVIQQIRHDAILSARLQLF
jgi:hypothetical protein